MSADAPPTLREFEAARDALRDVIRATPLVPVGDDADRLLIKPETLQPAGSFKVRGVLWAVRAFSDAARARGVSTVSAGNTAKALAWSARRFGVPARSVMPDHAPRTKIAALERLGGVADLRPVDEVFRYLRERLWEGEPTAFVHPWTSREVRVGHGSLGLEILDERPDVETVYLPVGGGGLLGGVGAALRAKKPGIRIVAVEPAGCPALHASLAAGRPTEVPCDTLCDGVAVPYITDEMFPRLAELVDDVVLVTEEEVADAIRALVAEVHLVAEGAGALAFAAARRTPAEVRGLAVAPITGGSIDRHVLQRILAG